MVQGWVFFPQGSGLDAGRLRLTDKLLPQFGIIYHRQPGLGRAKGGHIARCALAGGDVEVVSIHDSMGGSDDQHLRRPCCRLLCSGAISIDGALDLRFPPTAHSGDNNGRMGDNDSSQNLTCKHFTLLLSQLRNSSSNHFFSKLI